MRPLLTAALLTASTLPAQTPCPALTAHAILTGRHLSSPGHPKRLAPASAPDTFQLSLKLPSDAWFDPSDAGPLQRDGLDWNKAGGLSYLSPWRPGTWRMNAAAAMIGWRPAPDGGFAWCLYVNHADASFTYSEAQPLAADACLTVTVVTEPDCVTATFHQPDGSKASLSIPADILLSRRIPVSPWFGGNREAPQDITLYTDLRLGAADETP